MHFKYLSTPKRYFLFLGGKIIFYIFVLIGFSYLSYIHNNYCSSMNQKKHLFDQIKSLQDNSIFKNYLNTLDSCSKKSEKSIVITPVLEKKEIHLNNEKLSWKLYYNSEKDAHFWLLIQKILTNPNVELESFVLNKEKKKSKASQLCLSGYIQWSEKNWQ